MSLAWLAPASKSRLREWLFPLLGLAGLIIAIGFGRGFAILVAVAILSHLDAHPSFLVLVITQILAVVIPGYAITIAAQLIDNFFRRGRGLPPKKIEWIKVHKRVARRAK